MLAGYRDYRPSKQLTFWLCVLCIVATLLLGFSWAGWVTATTAEERVSEAVEDARIDLATSVCVARFKLGPDASAELEKLKDASHYRRDDLIEEAGWATLPGAEGPIEGVPDTCADQVAELESIAGAGTETVARGESEPS